jgi:serine/threonine-protein kinase HipA
MGDVLVVLMGKERAGTLTRLDNNRLQFEYDDAYRASRTATPLSLSMPLAIATHTDRNDRRTVTNFLWGLLPDNEAVIQRWARHYQVSATSPFLLLSTPVGEDCAGAVRFCPPEETDRLLARRGSVEWLSDSDVGRRLADLEGDNTAWLGRQFNGQFSLAGAQSKIALVLDGGRWGLPSGEHPTTHILKPENTGHTDHDINEHLCLAAAAYAGINATRSSVMRFGGQTALVVERYDRRVIGGEVVRVHQEDLCQALGLHPNDKYQYDNGPSASGIASFLRKALPYSSAQAAVWGLIDGLAWNWILAATDGHAKNYSLVLEGRDVAMAPLYDIASILPYEKIDRYGRDVRMAMSIGGNYAMHLGRGEWGKSAGEFGVSKPALLERVALLATKAPEAFEKAAAEARSAGIASKVMDDLVGLASERAKNCLDEIA